MLDAVGEQSAVCQPGDRVVEGLVAQLRFQAVPLGDVASVQHYAVDCRFVEHVRDAGLGVAPRAVRVAEPELADARGAGLGRDELEFGAEVRLVVGVDQLGDQFADQYVGLVTEERKD